VVATIVSLRGMDNGHEEPASRAVPGPGPGPGPGNPRLSEGAGAEDRPARDGTGGGFMPPTINLDQPDPECDLDFVPNLSRPTQAKVALVNCLAFGAKNSALVLRVL